MNDMESEPQIDVSLKEMIDKRDGLVKRLKSCERKLALISKERNRLWKSIRENNKIMNDLCEHDWSREGNPYDPYAPLKCRICGIEKP